MQAITATPASAAATLASSAQATGGWLLGEQQPGAGGPGSLLFPMVAIMLLGYFMFVRPQQTKQRRYEEMIKGLKENDQVVTTGGIYGVVTSVQRDAQRVTLRVDEGSGTKIRVGIWAISHLVGDENADTPGGGDRGKSTKKDSKTK